MRHFMYLDTNIGDITKPERYHCPPVLLPSQSNWMSADMSLIEDASQVAVPSLPEERRARRLPAKSYATALDKDPEDAGELDGYEEDDGSSPPKRQMSNGKKIQRSKKMPTKTEHVEKESLVEETYSNGDGLTSVWEGPEYNESLKLDKAQRRPEKEKHSTGLTSGRTAGAGWGRSKSAIPFTVLAISTNFSTHLGSASHR